MGKNYAISIIVPVYNIEAHVGKCLDSIINQTFTDFEVIVINDGSTDKSGDICDEYAKKDKRIKVVHQGKKGVSVARNEGINRATGDFIGFVDGDDYIDRTMYKKLYEACIDTGSSISICKLGREMNGEIINTNDSEYYTVKLTNEQAMKELFKGILYRFSLCNKLFDRDCFENITFPVGRIHEDLSTTYKLFAKAEQAVYLNFIGYIYVKQKESILTKSYYEKRLDAFIGWEEIIEFMRQNYPQQFNIVNSCFTYSCVDHIYYILNQVEDRKYRKEFLHSIQARIRTYYKDIRSNTVLSFNYKFIVLLINYHIGLFLLAYQLKKLQQVFFNRKD